MSSKTRSARWQLGPLAVALTALGALLYPLSWGPLDDSFPLSSYPMFSHGRPSPMLTISHAVGIREDGSREALEPLISAGNREVLQSMVTIQFGIRSGADAFCAEVAERARDEGFAEVEISTESWDAVEYFDSSPEEARRSHEVHARCPVPQ